MRPNFRYFALLYLNDWCRYDRGFVDGLLLKNDSEKRLDTLQNIATNYRIARNFPLTQMTGRANRFAKVLDALDRIPGPLTHDNVDSTVESLCEALQVIYKKRVLSATSKFLWMVHQSPVVIYDGNAVKTIGFKSNNYRGFRKKWLEDYSQQRNNIQQACSDLLGVKTYSLAVDMTDGEFAKLISRDWFQERIFDKYLWWKSERQL